MLPKITFMGAARTVTGSRHLIEHNGKKILIDCGLFQGPKEIRSKNWEEFPVDVRELDAIVLTHAHTDHIGFLPRLARLGYKGPIYATTGTIGLARVSLPDSGRLQQERAEYYDKKKLSRHNPPEPLFTEADAYNALKLFEKVHYFEWQELPGGMQFRYMPAGHILGSAFVEFYFENGEKILMGGDLGRWDRPIIKDPTMVKAADYLVIESTYGDKLHNPGDPKKMLHRILTDAYNSGGVVIVPSFAIGRTQELLYYMHELDKEGKLPEMPIYVDSPMANAATLLYLQEEDDHDKEMKIDLSEGNSPFRRDMVTFVRDREMSKQLNASPGPFVVIAGSGMMTGGRVLFHVMAHAHKQETTLLFTGYQAEGTLGRKIQEGAKEIEIFRRSVEVNCQCETMDMLSAHADYEEMLKWLKGFEHVPKTTFIVHGDEEAALSMQDHIRRELPEWDTVVPYQFDSFDLK